MQYHLIQSSRKSIAIKITKDGELEVHTPFHIDKKSLDEILMKKEKWIIENQYILTEKKKEREKFSKKVGDTLLLKGKEYKILESKENRVSFDGENFYMPSNLNFCDIRSTLVKLYRKIADEAIKQKVEYFQKLIGVTPESVKINRAKTIWGSCSGKKRLNFSWYLVMAKEETIDYVVVHELCHILELNHSKMFWREVEKIIPDYTERRGDLKKLQNRISVEAWE